jgi:outer membrane protein assembly factor BamB
LTKAQTEELVRQKPLRLWPGVVLVTLQWLGRFGVPFFVPEATEFGVIGAPLLGLAVVVWWAFFSRAPRSERWGAVVLMIVALVATSRIVHESIATGMMGLMFALYAIPILSLGFVAWAVISRGYAGGLRRVAGVVTVLLSCGALTLVKTGGFTSDLDHDFAWRWAETPEDRLLAEADDEPIPHPSTLASADEGPKWPGFRGRHRDGIIPGLQIKTDWLASPPVELWRRPIGPGWLSFAVHGTLFYTQEQRGEDEVVACYSMTTGEPVWRHRDPARFWESNAGAGPRGKPTLSGGRVYTFGATGILNALEAGDGAVIWSRNAASDTGAKLPAWGISSSPLVVGDVVIVATSGALVAYDLATGDPRWFGPVGGEGYSSPQLFTIGGEKQILQLNGAGLTGVSPADGMLLWEHPWSGYPIVQPALTAEGDILISKSSDSGTRRIAVRHGPGGWTVEERWTSIRLKSYFNDFVVHKGHAFGFDGRILACIDVEDGKRKWKGGRYGGGQLVLLPDQDVLLVLSELGELALVSATPDKFTELARFPGI